MNNIGRNLRTAVALALAAAGYVGAAQAAPVVSISPVSQDIAAVGGTASVDIVVSGLTQPDEAIGGYWLQLDFDSLLLEVTSFAVDPDGGMGAYDPLNDFSSDLGGGTLELNYLADLALSQADAALLQGNSFRLATVTFTGVAVGLSPLTLTMLDLSDFDGLSLVDTSSRNGSICVGGNCVVTVPEPGTYGLAGIALLAAGLAGRTRRRQETIV